MVWITAAAALLLAVGPAGARVDERWRRLRDGPAPARSGAAAVWTGEEMVVLGGTRLVEVTDRAKVQGAATHLDGSWFGFAVRFSRAVAAYDPGADRWRKLAPMPAVHVSAWNTEHVVWTGSEIVVPIDATLLVYTVATDTWRAVAYPDPRPQGGGAVVWTGTEVLFWGYPYHLPASAAWAQAFTPGADTWRAFDAGPLGFREHPGAAWTGSEMIVFGGRSGDDRAAAYEPTHDRWRPIAPVAATSFHTLDAFWNGREIVAIESGFGQEGAPVGLAYDTTLDRWRAISAPSGIARAEYALAWTGSEVLVVDGSRDLTGSDERAEPVRSASAYDPTSDSWRELPGIPGTVTCGSTVVWTGDAAIAWGGNRGCRIPTRPRPGTWGLAR